jgi:hypothetical protein
MTGIFFLAEKQEKDILSRDNSKDKEIKSFVELHSVFRQREN